jgi:glucan phosphoethanolaminetransferase (alkaline phosphatase superfamily)
MIRDGKKWPIKEHMSSLLGITLMISSTSAFLFVGKEPLINNDNKDEYFTPLFLVLLIQQIMFSHMNFMVDVCSSTNMRYSAWNSRFVFLTISYCTLICTAIAIFDAPRLFKLVGLYLLLLLAVVSKGHYAYNISMEMCDELGIRFFKTKPKQQIHPLDQETK